MIPNSKFSYHKMFWLTLECIKHKALTPSKDAESKYNYSKETIFFHVCRDCQNHCNLEIYHIKVQIIEVIVKITAIDVTFSIF